MALTTIKEPSFSYYIRHVKKISRLTEEQEYNLFQKIINDKCQHSIDTMISANLRFVVHLAYQFRHYNVPIADLVSEGNVGLIRAIKTFEPEYGVRFVTYASKWVKASMYEYITSNTGNVKFVTTKPKRKIFFNRGKLFDNMGNLRELSLLSQELDVPIRDIESYLTYSQPPKSLHNENGDYIDIRDKNDSISQLINDDYKNHQSLELTKALATLSEREIDILTTRYLTEEKTMLATLADRYNISVERVRQIEKQSLIKLRNIMTK